MPRKVAPSLDYRPRTDFVKLLERHPHLPRPVDVLFPEQAWPVACGILLEAVIEEHNRQTVEKAVLDPDGAERRPWDRLGIVDRVLHEGRAPGRQCEYRDVVSAIVCLNFTSSRNVFMLDTDEIYTLAGVAYGVGVSVRRDCPRVANRWIVETGLCRGE